MASETTDWFLRVRERGRSYIVQMRVSFAACATVSWTDSKLELKSIKCWRQCEVSFNWLE